MELLATIASLAGLIIAGFNAAIFIIIKFNDLSHLEKSVNEIKDTVKDFDKKLDANTVSIASIEANCKATHSRRRKR
jgi:hypothetical protein